MKQRILVVDDEISICDLLKLSLEGEGYEVCTACDGREALRKVGAFDPDLMILDVMLPEMNGFEVCKKVTADKPIPIIMLTAKSDLVDKVLGLELGADDYLTKPFHTRELTARIKALLRRVSPEAKAPAPRHLKNGCLEMIPDSRRVSLAGVELELSGKEYELLHFFMNHPEQVFSRDLLLEKVWGYDFMGDTRTVDVHVQRLRRKLKDEHAGSGMIQTVFGIGYRMRRVE